MSQSKEDFEAEFWGNCANTYGEETKQLVYAQRMGLRLTADTRSLFNIDVRGNSIIDIGGGPVSLLLKCINKGAALVVDPLHYPAWVYHRYDLAGITYLISGGEHINGPGTFNDLIGPGSFDEAWIYNVLQHVDDPAKILANAREIARRVRIFEWIDIRPYPGHPHMLTEQMLSEALGGPGLTEWLNESGCQGRCFSGVFST